MNGYVDPYAVAFLVVWISSAIDAEQGIASRYFRILSVEFGDSEQVQRLNIEPDAIEMEIP